MRLVEFCPYYPPHTGGLETHAAEFNSQLAAEKGIKDIIVFTPRLPESAAQMETEGRITIIRFPAFEPAHNYAVPKFWMPSFWYAYRQIRVTPDTVVISRTRFFYTSLMAWWFSFTRRIPWVHIEHGSDFIQVENKVAGSIARAYDEVFGRFVLVRATQVVAISKAVANFVGRFRTGDIPVIYRGVNQSLIFSAQPRADLVKKYADKIKVVFVGRLIDGKGVMDLCRAIEQLPESVVCFVVGDGPQRSEIENFVSQKNLTHRFVLFGNLKQNEAIAVLKSSDIFVNPSYTEGLPSSVIEAALCRLCIIATDVGGTSEIFTDGSSGYLIAPKDIDALVIKITEAGNNRMLRKDFGRKAFELAQAQFSWVESGRLYRTLFQKIQNKRG